MTRQKISLSRCLFVFVALLLIHATVFAQSATAPLADVEEAKRLNQEAIKLHDAGNYAEALKLAKQALKLREDALGKNHEMVGRSLFNVGTICFSSGQYLDAEPFYARALKIYESVFGVTDDRLSTLIERLGWIQHYRGNGKHAEVLFKRQLALAEKNHAEQSDDVELALLTLSSFYEKNGQPALAVPVMMRVHEIQEKIYGEVHQRVADSAEKCGCLMDITRNAKGGEYYEKARLLQNKLSNSTLALPSGMIVGKAIHKEAPEYPPAAKQAKLKGAVIVKITIDEGGKVLDAKKLCGADLLAPGAVNAARKWRFTPPTVDGKPIKAVGVLTFNFTW